MTRTSTGYGVLKQGYLTLLMFLEALTLFLPGKGRISPYVLKIYFTFITAILYIPGGVVVSIAAFHSAGPGSIPGVGELFFSFFS